MVSTKYVPTYFIKSKFVPLLQSVCIGSKRFPIIFEYNLSLYVAESDHMQIICTYLLLTNIARPLGRPQFVYSTYQGCWKRGAAQIFGPHVTTLPSPRFSNLPTSLHIYFIQSNLRLFSTYLLMYVDIVHCSAVASVRRSAGSFQYKSSEPSHTHTAKHTAPSQVYVYLFAGNLFLLISNLWFFVKNQTG